MLDKNGYEIPDDTPVAIPARLRLPTSRAAQIQGFIRAEMSRMAQDNGAESFEEANDLDVEEFHDFPMTPYEMEGEEGNPFLEPSLPADNTEVQSKGEPSIVPNADEQK